MARQPRFLLSERMHAPGEYCLDSQESHHAAHVLRLGLDDAVIVFDGEGNFAEAVIISIAKDAVRVRVDEVKVEKHLPLFLTIATCIPKGKRWQTLVEKCTELGVDRIIPLLSERSVVKGEGDVGKWRRWAVEAAKQSRRSWLPEVLEPRTVSEVVAGAKKDNAFLLLADPGGESPRHFLDQLKHVLHVVAVIGPEGGFTEDERKLLVRQGGHAVSLSPFVLRVETAAAAICAILRDILA